MSLTIGERIRRMRRERGQDARFADCLARLRALTAYAQGSRDVE